MFNVFILSGHGHEFSQLLFYHFYCLQCFSNVFLMTEEVECQS